MILCFSQGEAQGRVASQKTTFTRKVIRYNKQSVPGGVDKEDDEWTTAPEAFCSASSTEDDADIRPEYARLFHKLVI
uniref:Uncharacterized protein n=1 Tax=Globodera rostochiensis TaxID=31243 RepID=A0A914HTW5_GLORO